MAFLIAGLGTAVPQHAVTQPDAALQAAGFSGITGREQRLLEGLYRRAGVRSRHSVLLTTSTNGAPAEQVFYEQRDDEPRGPSTAARMARYEQDAAPLAIDAARQALADADTAAGDVTDLVTVSCSGFAAPGLDMALLAALGLPRSVSRTHVGFMGCHGAINGLRVADALAASRPAGNVLLVAVELCSLHHQYGWNPEQVVANALFADGAAAVVGRVTESPAEGDWHVAATGSAILPDTEELMSWRIGDHGFEMSLSPLVPEVILRMLGAWLAAWLAEQGLAIEDVGSWAVHPGGPRILDACATAIGRGDDAVAESRQVLAELGNMSSPTVLFILDRLRRRNAPLPCVLLAFGPGLAIEAALIR